MTRNIDPPPAKSRHEIAARDIADLLGGNRYTKRRWPASTLTGSSDE